ncbi:unnamed protein product [Bubo scandiacus]
MAVFWISLPGAGAAPVAHGTARREQCVHPGDPAAMKRMMKVLRALCPCVGSQFSPARPEKGGRATGTVPADFMTFVDVRTSLLKRLQDHEGDRVETYRELEIVLHGNNSFLTSGAVNRLIAEASRDMRAAQGVTCEVKMVASNVLVALARSHFHFVMAELQSNLKAMGKVPDEIVLLTLGKMAHSYALRCIPFVRMTMLALHTMLNPVGSGRILRAVCSVLEQWSKAVNTYFCKREQCPFPGKGVAQFCEAIYPVFRYVVVNWLECTGEEDKQAVLGAVAAMMGVLLHEEQHREHAWEQLPWLLHQYHQVLDTFWVSKSLCYVLEVLEGVQTPIPQGTALAIRTAVHRQLSDVTPQPGPAHQAVLTRCMVLQARMCPEQTAVTLHSLLSGGSEAGRMAALGLLGALAHSDGQARALPWPLEMAAQQGRCSKLSNTSRVVGERAGWCAQELCVPMLFCLSSASAVTPQLLSALSPGWGHRRCEGDGTARARHLTQPFFLSAAQLPAPQVLLSRLLVVAAAPYAKRERAVAALQLLQTLHGRIHRALGAAWVTEIPLLLQYLQGRTESTLHSAEWKHRVLQFLRASLEPIEDQTWTVGLSQELSQQLGSSAPRSWEKLFLYKALGTALAACRDLRHVQGQVLRFLQETNPVELSEAQGMVSVVSYAAESHFHLVLDTVTMFSAAFTRDGFYQTSTGLEVQRGQNMESAQATCAALMRTYSGIALRAPKEQLLTRVDREILGSILQLSRAKQRDLVLKMALVESITEVSCAIQAVGDCGTFELSLKQEAMQTLLDWIKGEPWDSLVYGVFHVLEELSKLRPPLSREENRNLLSVCCQSALSYPSKEQMEKGRRTGRAAVNVQILNRRNMEDLGHLIETLLETEATSACFDDVVLVLKGWLTSAKEWERERALWVCAHVLGTCKERCELLRGGPCKQLGSLVGLLGFLTTDYLAMSRQRAWVCLGYLLQMQAKTMKVVPQADEIGSLCEKLNSPDTETSLEACTKIRKAVCKCIPPAQATDFLTANLDSLLHVTPIRARVWWEWVFAFLVESRKEILQEVPQILNTLCTYYMWQSTHRPFLLHAVFLLAHFHREPVISSLLQKGLPMDSDTVTVWRSLGGEIFGIQILRCLVEKLSRAGNDPLGTDSSACEGHSPQTALETVTITFAISEVVLALRSTEELRQLLPHLLPCLLRWASETLGEERLLSPRSSYKQLFLTGRVLEQKPCRIFLSAIELVLGRCMAQKWMRLLMRWAVWACLEDPLAHPEGVSLLSSEVTMAVFWISLPGAGAAPVAHGTARREQCVHPGDPAAMKRMMKVLRALCPCVGSQFSPARPEKGGRATGTVPADFMTFVDVRTSLLKRLQDHEGDRVETYRELEIVLHGNNSFLTSGAVNRLIAEASRDMRAAQGVTCEVKMVASNVLVALARSHFHFVMAELQSNLKAMGKVPDEIVLLTLGKMAHSYALRCIPFMRMTMLALHTMLNPVGSGRILRAVCSVLEQWSKAVNTYFCKREQCPFPGKGVAQFCEAIYPVFRYVVVNWLECTGEEDKQAVLRAVAAMMGVLLREEQHREHAWEQLPWLLHQYHQVLDTFWVSKSLCYVLEVLEGVQTPIPEGTALAIRTDVHRQLSDVTPQPGPAHQAVLTRCMVLQARMCPEQTAMTLHSLLSGGSEAGRMAALGLLGALAHSDGQARALPWPLEMAAQQGRCSKLSNTSRVVGERAGWCAQELPRFSVPSECCWVWPGVVPVRVSLHPTSPEQEPRKTKGQRQELCPAPFFLSAAQLPAPQVLLSRLLVVAAAPYAKRERAVAALQLLQTLHGRIHRALGAAWVTEIPLLLQYLQGRTESTLHSAEWKHRMLQFLRASLEPIEDQTWTVGLSQELSQQLGSSAPRSWEKLFLYKALGTALAACRDLRHVQGQVLRFLQETNPVELSEAQGMVSVVSYAAESHFHLVLDTVTMFSAAFTRDGFYQTSTGLERGQNMESAQATCAALMRTYSGIALRAPKEQLLTRVDREILGSILQLSRAKQRDLVLKMALVESITEVSCAIQAVGDCGTFELSLKQEAMQTLLDWIKGEPWDSLVYGVFHVLEELSKLRPPLSREENRNLLSVCCQSALSYPSKEQMEKGRRTGRAAVNVQILNRRNMEDLGHLIETLLETEATSACFDDVVLVLKGWLTSAKEWERERALWVCAHVLGTCKERCELLRGGPCKQLGSLVGLLGFLTTDYLAMSRQRAWVCLGYLLQMQAKTMKVVPQADEIGSLCEKLNSPDTETSLEACTKIRKAVCKCIPPAQATDFLTANLDSLLHVTPIRARVWWEWVFAFLVESRKEILQEVPQILNTLCTYYMWQSTHRPFLLHAVFLLAHFHREPVISSLLQKGLPMDSDTVTVWRSLGGEIFGIQILRCLVEKLSRAGNDPLGTDSSACEGHSPQTALETVTITFAISEVVLALRSTEELRQLLPHLLPCLLRWASETLGEERLLSPRSSYKQLFLTGRVLEQKPCRIFLSAIELVLGRCMAQKWMRLLMRWAVWACLEDPLAHPEGVSLLSSEVTMAVFWISLPGAGAAPVAHGTARREQCVHPGDPAAMKRMMKVLRALCPCVGSQFSPARPEKGGRATGTVPADFMTFVDVRTSLLKRLQDHEGDRVETYRELEIVLHGNNSFLTSGAVNRLIAEASRDMRAAQGVTCEVKMVASNVLVALARSHFHFVMAELQSNLKAMGKVPDEIVLLTLGKMAHSYALRCIPFMRMTMLALHTMLNPVGSGRILRAVCSVLEQWSKAVNTYFCKREQCPFPGKGVAQFCEAIYPVFRYVVVNWLECTGEEVSSAAFHSWGRSGDAHVSGSVCAQWGVSRGARGGGQVLGPFCREGWATSMGRCSLLWSELFSCRAEGKGKPLPVGRADGSLSPGWGHRRCEGDGTARARHLTQPFFLSAAQLPAPQVLLSRLLVVAAAPYAKRERAVAALQLLQTLHGRIHRALGAAWVTEIPLLLQYLQGRTESTLHSAEWKHRVLQFLRASLEPIEDQTWTVGLSQELSQQLGSSAPRSWEKLFLYKALGTALAACRDLRHVQGQVLRFLQETNPVELSEAQGMVSVVSYAAESHFHLVLDTVTMFSAAFTRDGFYQTSTGLERGQNMESAQATCAALMRTYSGIALRAPKEQLLTRVDREILGSILQLSRAKQRDLVLKMALVESITEVSCAIQAVGDCGTFELSLKQEAMQTLLDWIKGEPWDSLVYGVFHVLEELSKLRPPLSREENRNLLSVCCQSALSYPSKEQMEKGRRTGRAAVNVQILNRRNMEDLGHLIETLLETEATSACFDDVVLVLKGWLTSAKEWERERALWVCAHVLGTCKERCELLRGGPCKQLGSLVGLLGFLTTDYLAMSRQRAWVCLGYLLQMQAKTMKVVPQADEIGSLCEKLNSPDTETSLEACTKIRKAVCKCIPPAQATDFLTANLDSLLHVTPIRARVWWEWVFAFLVESRKEILQEVPQILNTLCTYYMWQSTHRPFLLHAVFLLAHFHREPVISSLLQKGLPMDSDTVTVWRSLGGEIFGIQILRCLVEKLSRAGNDPLGTDSSACEGHSPQTALETVTITFAISEVVLALRSTEELRQLLPHLLPCLLRWASETLGEERLLSPRSSYKQLFLTGRVLEQKPCRIFLSAIELVLGRCMAQKWMRLLMRWAVWACLEDPLAHPEGVSLLSR